MTGSTAGRDAPVKRALRAIAAQAAALSAAVHLLWAWPHLTGAADPRPFVFLLGGLFTVLVAVATLKADEYRRLYALGAGTLSAFILGYVGWHGSGVVGAISADPLALVGKTAEVVGVVAFVGLYRLAPPTVVLVERRRQEREESENEGNASDTGSEDDGYSGDDDPR